MNKNTASSQQFIRRDGNHSTKPSARGTNLLGWGEAEQLSPEHQRAAMAARVTQINWTLRDNKQMPKAHRAALIAEQNQLVAHMREIRPTRRAPGVEVLFIDVARERLTDAEFRIWMTEAAKRLEAAQQATLEPA